MRNLVNEAEENERDEELEAKEEERVERQAIKSSGTRLISRVEGWEVVLFE